MGAVRHVVEQQKAGSISAITAKTARRFHTYVPQRMTGLLAYRNGGAARV
jgi:hypothetical protein